MFQKEYPYGFSIIDTSLNYEILDYFPNVIVSDSDNVTSLLNSLYSSSYSGTLSCSKAEKSYSTKKLSILQARGGSGDEPSQKRRTRRRTRSEITIKDKENQRMNHITVERNRRRQMNHFLSVLKSMMPICYTQRCDQASIIEGTIGYLKKQEQLLQSLEAQLKATKPNQSPYIFSDFFIFPQYSTASWNHHHLERQAAVADVRVTIVERHANIKVLTKTRPRLLFKIINDFYSLGLSTIHLNLTTSKDMSLFTISVKVEEDCQLTISVNEIANAVHEVVRRIHRGSYKTIKLV